VGRFWGGLLSRAKLANQSFTNEEKFGLATLVGYSQKNHLIRDFSALEDIVFQIISFTSFHFLGK